MTFLTVDTANQDTVKLNGVSKGLDGVFIAAILLTGSAEQAERAVVETIETKLNYVQDHEKNFLSYYRIN